MLFQRQQIAEQPCSYPEKKDKNSANTTLPTACWQLQYLIFELWSVFHPLKKNMSEQLIGGWSKLTMFNCKPGIIFEYVRFKIVWYYINDTRISTLYWSVYLFVCVCMCSMYVTYDSYDHISHMCMNRYIYIYNTYHLTTRYSRIGRLFCLRATRCSDRRHVR